MCYTHTYTQTQWTNLPTVALLVSPIPTILLFSVSSNKTFAILKVGRQGLVCDMLKSHASDVWLIGISTIIWSSEDFSAKNNH